MRIYIRRKCFGTSGGRISRYQRPYERRVALQLYTPDPCRTDKDEGLSAGHESGKGTHRQWRSDGALEMTNKPGVGGIASTDKISTADKGRNKVCNNSSKNKSCSRYWFSPWGLTPSRSLTGTRCMDRWDEGSWDTIPIDTEGSPP